MYVQNNKNLIEFNTLAVPSTASYFVQASSIEDVVDAVSWGQEQTLAIYVIGGGSNIILESVIGGLIIKPDLMGVQVTSDTAGSYLVTAGAGENWHKLVEYCVISGYFGIENLALIPGNVGAAPIQNIGAYGVELEDVFFELKALEISTRKVRTFSFEECDFNYRESAFKNRYRNQYIVLSVTLRLTRKEQPRLTYPALKQALLKNNPSAVEVMNKVVEIRRSKLPDPKIIPNAGSFFKNPIVDVDKCEQLKKQFKDLVFFDMDSDKKKLAAAWLIEKSGWKGKEKYGIKVHSDHALVLTNPHFCGADEVLRAVNDIQHDVHSLFGIDLELEPQRFV